MEKEKTITDYTNGRLKEIIDFADTNNLTDEFWLTMSRLYRYLSEGYDVVIGTDFAHMSMSFAIERKGHKMNGGIIYHEHSKGWSIHT